MKNIKQEFAAWLLKNAPDSYRQYLGTSIQTVVEKLNEINSYFTDRDIFSVDKANPEELIQYLKLKNSKSERIKNNAFFKYDKEKSNGIPKAILGKNNYVKFLVEKFNMQPISIRNNRFTWVETHKQLIKYLLSKENNQHELIDLLKFASVTGFKDGEENGLPIELKEIDPFTFFFFIYKYGSERRLSILRKIARKLNLPIPTDDYGIPSVQPLKVCLFPFKEFRKNNEISRLWNFFKDVLNDTISDENFADILTINSTGKTKLTEGLFDVSPEKFLPINGPTKPYLQEVFEIDPKFNTFSEYKAILEKVRQKTSKPFYEISYDAWKWNNSRSKTNYWVFQGNPDVFDYKTALEQNLVVNWTVTAHKNQIKIGDKVILWITGSNAGCYALAEVTSKPTKILESPDNHLWKKEDLNSLKAEIKITHNLINNPITNSQIKNIPELSSLKVGNQGTNFASTKEEFEEILKLINDTKTMGKESNLSLNQIFFGPPGTGKTYNTINEAIKIADPEFYALNEKNRDKLKERFKLLLINADKEGNGQIAFTTFHQSFSYEDFVEGIKPLKPKVEDTFLKYDIQDGIFKDICIRAENSLIATNVDSKEFISLSNEEFDKSQFYKMSLGNSLNDEGKVVFDYCAKNNCITIGFGEYLDFTGKDEKELKDFGIEKGLKPYDIQALNYFKNYLKEGNYVIISYGNGYIRAIGKVAGEYEFKEESPFLDYPSYNHFRKVEWIFNDKMIETNAVYHKNLSQQTIYKLDKNEIKKDFFVKEKKLDQLKLPKNPKNFVLIIDEINRGNVSSIFGELITLIEKDKRTGGTEELSVILPYSKKEFKVPQNVYLIGTMNTADRSIEALDTALRRRFSFKEMPPKSYLISDESKLKGTSGKIDNINVLKILDTINDRIEKLIDKDHKIGHSYFMDIENESDLQQAFKNKVIPLLEEYFFGDFGKIGLILGKSFITKTAKEAIEFAEFNEYDSSIRNDLMERSVFEITDQDTWNFESIYKQNPVNL